MVLLQFIIQGDTDGLPFCVFILCAHLHGKPVSPAKGHLSGATKDPILPSFPVQLNEFFIRTVLCKAERRDVALSRRL